MTDTTAPWMPVLIFGSQAENCAVCGDVLTDNYLATITVGKLDSGPTCQECTEALGEAGEGLWLMAEGLDRIDSAMCKLPQVLRSSMTKRAIEVVEKVLEWRIGPVTDEEKVEHVAEMAAQGKFLSLPGSRMVKAAEYDPEKHGPFLP